MLDFGFYKDKKVFVTGHTGFKGSWMITWLNQLGAVVKGYALDPDLTAPLFNIIQGKKLCLSTIADIRDDKKLEKEITGFQPDVIFHMAAQPLVRLSYQIPVETFGVNTLGTVNLLNACRNLDKQCIIVLITTDKVYKNNEWNYPYREVDVLGGHDPYSASKACAELVIDCYRNSYFNPGDYKDHKKAVASARAGNVIGGGDWAMDRIVPDIIRSLQKNEEIQVRYPQSIRPWQHVLEPLSGYLQLGLKMNEAPELHSSAWNFGPLEEGNVTVEDLVKKSIISWGSGSYRKAATDNQWHEAATLKLDIHKTISHLSWKPRWDAAMAIDKTIQWYKKYLNGAPPAELIAQDIKEYSA